jgi:hypothetical protein
MPISEYMRDLRARVGTTLVLVPSVTALIFDDDDRLLLARHSNGGVWSYGCVDPDRRRRTRSCAGVGRAATPRRPIAVLGSFGGPSFRITYTNGDVVSYVIAAYECRRLGGTLRPDGEEIFEARYCAASELASILLAPWAVEILPTLMRRRAGWVPPVTWRPPAGG